MLKVPIIALLYLVWWAIKDPPEPVVDEDGGSPDRDPRPHPRDPRRARRAVAHTARPSRPRRARPRGAAAHPAPGRFGSFRAVEGFYIAGGVLAAWALHRDRSSACRREDFPSTPGATRLVGAISIVLVVTAIGLAIYLSATRGARVGRRRGGRGPRSRPVVSARDDGLAVHYTALQRGTPVFSSDGEDVGKVDQVLDNYREHIFDGLVIKTASAASGSSSTRPRSSAPPSAP